MQRQYRYRYHRVMNELGMAHLLKWKPRLDVSVADGRIVAVRSFIGSHFDFGRTAVRRMSGRHVAQHRSTRMRAHMSAGANVGEVRRSFVDFIGHSGSIARL